MIDVDKQPQPPATPPTPVVITGVNIKFGDMVALLFQVGVAAIPAGLLVGVLVAIIMAFASAAMR